MSHPAVIVRHRDRGGVPPTIHIGVAGTKHGERIQHEKRIGLGSITPINRSRQRDIVTHVKSRAYDHDHGVFIHFIRRELKRRNRRGKIMNNHLAKRNQIFPAVPIRQCSRDLKRLKIGVVVPIVTRSGKGLVYSVHRGFCRHAVAPINGQFHIIIQPGIHIRAGNRDDFPFINLIFIQNKGR